MDRAFGSWFDHARLLALGLHVHNDDPQQDFRVSAFITTLAMNRRFTGKFKRTK